MALLKFLNVFSCTSVAFWRIVRLNFSNIGAADKIETNPDKNVVMPPVSSPNFCLLLQKTQFKVGQKL